jgi:hypothetical protein
MHEEVSRMGFSRLVKIYAALDCFLRILLGAHRPWLNASV